MAHTYDDINNWYTQYLGHSVGGQDSGWASWADDPNAENNIKNSAEGQAYAAKGSAAPAPASATDQWGNQQGSQQAGTDAFWNAVTNNKQTSFDPAQLQGWGVTQIAPDKYRLANGQMVDTIRDYGGADQAAGQWSITGGQQGENGQGVNWGADPSGHTMVAGGGASGGGSGSGSSFDVSSSTGQDAALRAQLVAQLTQRAQQGLAVDANDPNIKQQVDPFRAEQDRSERNYMADLAEKSGANYGASNLEGQDRLAHEQAGQNTGNFQAALIGKELDSKRQEIQQALTGMQGILTEEQRNQLQMQLAQINDATQRLGIQTQATTASNNTALGFSNLDWLTNPANPNNIPNFNSNA